METKPWERALGVHNYQKGAPKVRSRNWQASFASAHFEHPGSQTKGQVEDTSGDDMVSMSFCEAV